MMILSRSILSYVGAAGVAVVLAGCQSGTAGSGQATAGGSGGEQQVVAIGREYSQCVREHGVPNFPDMVVLAGRMTLPDDASGDAGEQALRANPAAREACGSILERLPAAAQKDRGLSVQDRESLLRYAQCLRDKGVPEWPDPQADGSFPITGTALEGEGKSTRFQSAAQSCRQYWDKEISIK